MPPLTAHETWPNDPSPLRCRRCTCTTDSTRFSLSPSRARAYTRVRAQGCTFSPYVPLPRRCSLTFFYSNFRSVYLNLPLSFYLPSNKLLRTCARLSPCTYVRIAYKSARFSAVALAAVPFLSFFLSSSSFFFFLHASRLFTCAPRTHGQKTRRLYWRHMYAAIRPGSPF